MFFHLLVRTFKKVWKLSNIFLKLTRFKPSFQTRSKYLESFLTILSVNLPHLFTNGSIKVLLLQQSEFKKPSKNLNVGTVDQSAALIKLQSQSKLGESFQRKNTSCLDLPVNCDHAVFADCESLLSC